MFEQEKHRPGDEIDGVVYCSCGEGDYGHHLRSEDDNVYTIGTGTLVMIPWAAVTIRQNPETHGVDIDYRAINPPEEVQRIAAAAFEVAKRNREALEYLERINNGTGADSGMVLDVMAILDPSRGLCDGCDQVKPEVAADDAGRGIYCKDCLPAANAAYEEGS